MKDLLTKNLGLKIVSVLAAFLLWLVVVNVDDPVISKTYSGIAVEVLSEDTLTQQGKCYEVIDNTDVVNVVVTAKRSVLDEISRDYIRATADLKQLSSSGTVPIEVRSTRYSDKIESVSTRTVNLNVLVENLVEKTIPVSIAYTGEPEDGYIVYGVDSSCDSVTVTGPESSVALVDKVIASDDITAINKDYVITEALRPYDFEGNEIEDPRITLSRSMTEVRYYIYATKVIPISSGFSGEPMNGFGVSGTVIANPSSVLVAGKGENFDDMEVIYISPDEVPIDGASSDVTTLVSIKDYLPTGVVYADPDFVPEVEVTIGILQNEHKIIEVPLSNIMVENVPEGYQANIVDIGGNVSVEIQGIGDTFDRFSGDLVIGTIDAASLVPRSIVAGQEGAPLTTGENDGEVMFDFPAGISIVNPVSLQVIVDYIGVNDNTEGIEILNE